MSRFVSTCCSSKRDLLNNLYYILYLKRFVIKIWRPQPFLTGSLIDGKILSGECLPTAFISNFYDFSNGHRQQGGKKHSKFNISSFGKSLTMTKWTVFFRIFLDLSRPLFKRIFNSHRDLLDPLRFITGKINKYTYK